MHAVGQNAKPDGCALNPSHLNGDVLIHARMALPFKSKFYNSVCLFRFG